MTRKEAINHLSTYSTTMGSGQTSDLEHETAKKMAIEALKKEIALGKIRTEIDRQEKWLAQAGYNAYNVEIAFNSIKLVLAAK